MKKRILAAGIVLLAVAGLFGAGKWRDHRVAACEQRGARFSALDVLSRQPDGFHPAGSPTAGCDIDRVTAYATRQFLAATGGPTGDATAGNTTTGNTTAGNAGAAQLDQSAIAAFYGQILKADGWRVPDPSRTDLCAGKNGTYANLTFPYAGAYELDVADRADAACA